MVFRNCLLSEFINACLKNDMKLYAMTIKFPPASVAQKLRETKSPGEKSYLSFFIPFPESALLLYVPYTALAGRG